MKSSRNNGNFPLKEQGRIDVEGIDLLDLTGPQDRNLRLLEGKFGGSLVVRQECIVISGEKEPSEKVQKVITELVQKVRKGQLIDEMTVSYLWQQNGGASDQPVVSGPEAEPLLFASGSRMAVRTKTLGQQEYVDAVRRDDVVFSIGPAGTGKTFLAVVMAMDYLKQQLVDRIILVRPAVEAGEQLGFLPGDLQDKINPYLRPLFDALSDIMGRPRFPATLPVGSLKRRHWPTCGAEP